MEVTAKILEKYSNGQCSEEEICAVEDWLNSANEEDTELEGVPFSQSLEKRMLENIQKEITVTKVNKSKKNSLKKIVWSVAASVALFIGIGSYLFSKDYDEYNTQIGEIQTITLSDGTKVTLNAASQLKVPKNFSTTTRIVQLEGEAYFEVTKDSLHPFTIETLTATTEVLGTKFNLSSYSNDLTTLTLNEGMVLFYKQGENKKTGVILLPNQQVVLRNNILETKEVNSSFSKAWMQKQFVYKATSVKEVLHDIERSYGVAIKTEKEGLKDRLYRGNHNNPTLDEIMQTMSFVLNFKYRVVGKTITIY